MARVLEDLSNKEFGRLKALRRVKGLWECRCLCGNYKNIKAADLKRNYIKSCGCLRDVKHNNLYLQFKGKRFNNWTITDGKIERIKKQIYLNARCDCGVLKKVLFSYLKSGRSRSCRSCAMKKKIEKKKYGKLTVINFKNIYNGNAVYSCICVCGSEINVSYHHLTSGKVKSCGCSRYDINTRLIRSSLLALISNRIADLAIINILLYCIH